ncbi:uncharacterized protein [Aegilops tauschii subsp. strangulata]|uniref:uncharacterized protein isoform X2 n=1 Tax=Aegilops tauschii subsp. strangulata TaxID=200361 RepID=UPI003CC83C69
MDGFRKVSFLPGWSELQIPSGPREPAISASSSPLPLGITSSPNASSAPSDRPQREIGHGGNKTAQRCAFLQHIRRKKKQHEVHVCIKLLSLIFCRICSFYGTTWGLSTRVMSSAGRLSYRTGEMQQKKLLRCYSPNSKQKGPSTFLANGASVCSESDTTI